MKYILLLFTVFSFSVYAQNEQKLLIFDSYQHGTYVYKKCFFKTFMNKQIPVLSISNNDTSAKNECRLVSYEIRVYGFDYKKNYFMGPTTDITKYVLIGRKTLTGNVIADEELIAMFKQIGDCGKIVLKNILFEKCNSINGNGLYVLTGMEIQIITPDPGKPGELESEERCAGKASATLQEVNYKGKLLTGKNKDEPLANQKLLLKDKSEKEIQNTQTDKYGDFAFTSLNTNESYNIVLDGDVSKIKEGVVIMAKQNGSIVKTFTKKGNTFAYELFPLELSALAKVKEDDTELNIKNFNSSKENNLTILETIHYPTNSAEFNEDAQKMLDKVIKSMKENNALKLAIASHTDSNGDDDANMVLSETRAKIVMNYIVSKGVAPERISAKGYGETQILNRCKNGVDCTEMEHELNRRTEFKFTK